MHFPYCFYTKQQQCNREKTLAVWKPGILQCILQTDIAYNQFYTLASMNKTFQSFSSYLVSSIHCRHKTLTFQNRSEIQQLLFNYNIMLQSGNRKISTINTSSGLDVKKLLYIFGYTFLGPVLTLHYFVLPEYFVLCFSR